jgi:hypothetical protein
MPLKEMCDVVYKDFDGESDLWLIIPATLFGHGRLLAVLPFLIYVDSRIWMCV